MNAHKLAWLVLSACLLCLACGKRVERASGGEPAVGPKAGTVGVESPVPAKGKIAFVSFRDGNQEIYVMNSDGTSQTRITNNPAGNMGPAWSPAF